MRNINLFLIAVYAIFSFGCSGSKPKAVVADTLATIDTDILADKNYAYHNLENTMPLWEQMKFDDGKMYADSTHKLVFTELTQQQKLKLVAPFIMKELDVKDKECVTKFMQAYFISKQEKVGAYQPIILSIGGDDYSSFTMIILDKNNTPVDGYNLCGGMDGGPSTIGDSLTNYDLRSYSHFAKNMITTYRLDASEYNDSLKRPVIIDSNVFKSIIDNNGKIKAIQIVKATYNRPYKPWVR